MRNILGFGVVLAVASLTGLSRRRMGKPARQPARAAPARRLNDTAGAVENAVQRKTSAAGQHDHANRRATNPANVPTRHPSQVPGRRSRLNSGRHDDRSDERHPETPTRPRDGGIGQSGGRSDNDRSRLRCSGDRQRRDDEHPGPIPSNYYVPGTQTVPTPGRRDAR